MKEKGEKNKNQKIIMRKTKNDKYKKQKRHTTRIRTITNHDTIMKKHVETKINTNKK